MRRETPFTLEEAKDYLQQTIAEWETIRPAKIIALAGSAYNQRNKKATVSTAAKMKVIQTNINAVEAMIGRKTKLDIDANTDRLDEEKQELYNELEALKGILATTTTNKPVSARVIKRKPAKPSQFTE